MFVHKNNKILVCIAFHNNIDRIQYIKKVIDYIDEHYDEIEKDMNNRNSTSKRQNSITDNSKTRKKREELSISATKSIKKEEVEIVVKFH